MGSVIRWTHCKTCQNRMDHIWNQKTESWVCTYCFQPNSMVPDKYKLKLNAIAEKWLEETNEDEEQNKSEES